MSPLRNFIKKPIELYLLGKMLSYLTKKILLEIGFIEE